MFWVFARVSSGTAWLAGSLSESMGAEFSGHSADVCLWKGQYTTVTVDPWSLAGVVNIAIPSLQRHQLREDPDNGHNGPIRMVLWCVEEWLPSYNPPPPFSSRATQPGLFVFHHLSLQTSHCCSKGSDTPPQTQTQQPTANHSVTSRLPRLAKKLHRDTPLRMLPTTVTWTFCASARCSSSP